jgi:hypothetical protein
MGDACTAPSASAARIDDGEALDLHAPRSRVLDNPSVDLLAPTRIEPSSPVTDGLFASRLGRCSAQMRW